MTFILSTSARGNKSLSFSTCHTPLGVIRYGLIHDNEIIRKGNEREREREREWKYPILVKHKDLQFLIKKLAPPLTAALLSVSPICHPPESLGQTLDIQRGVTLFNRACIGCHDTGGNIIQPFKFLVTRPKCNVFMINARELSITWSENSEYWTWLALPKQNQNETVVEIAYLRKASWLQVAGKFDTRHLYPRTMYEVVFVVGVVHTKFRWDKPVKLKLVMSNSCEKPQERSVKMGHYISNQWVDIPVGEFTTSMNNVGEISFEMYEHECQLWKSGLFVKSVIIRPKY
ncbi:Protein PHLOEM PROTEIN 2-LIKE A5 [Cardamine amara subsp. amara]|uniref:Protein PHLOEM PROTEIN 2-LIKE A5 n=1 Tax=Cardamine amara subsp. amara TaxID=228776 RepID=A0ABD1C3H0_CARAN